MKRVKNIFKLLVVAIFLFSSCDKIEELLTFNIHNSTDFVIKNTVVVNLPFDIPTPSITTNSETEFKNNNTASHLVKNIYLDKLQLSIIKPEGATFSFLKSITIYISADGMKEIELASITDIDENANIISLDPTNEKLDGYVKGDKYSLRTQVTTNKIVTDDTTIKADMTFKVTANPF
jgi:hypothetical protein